MAQDIVTLYVYDSDFGLPSFNPECIQSILYATICKVPVQINILNNIKHCSSHSAPCLVHKGVSIKLFSDGMVYLKTLEYNLDANLTAKMQSGALALTNLIYSRLKPAVEYTLWIDQRNCSELTEVWFAKTLPLFFNRSHVKRLKKKAIHLFGSFYSEELNNEDLIRNTTECLAALSAKLGMSKYFFGDQPVTVDVLVYSYLTILLKVRLPSSEISNLVSSFQNLVRYVERLDQTFFPNLKYESKYLKHENVIKKDEGVSYLAVFLMTVSTMSLFGFALKHGLMIPKLYNTV